MMSKHNKLAIYYKVKLNHHNSVVKLEVLYRPECVTLNKKMELQELENEMEILKKILELQKSVKGMWKDKMST